MIGTCIIILREYNMPDKNECLSLCLDTAACRGASYRYRGGTCFLHDCGYHDYLFDGGRVFMQLNCTGNAYDGNNKFPQKVSQKSET